MYLESKETLRSDSEPHRTFQDQKAFFCTKCDLETLSLVDPLYSTVSVNKKRHWENQRNFLLPEPFPFIFGYVPLCEKHFLWYRGIFRKLIFDLSKLQSKNKTLFEKREICKWEKRDVFSGKHGISCDGASILRALESTQATQKNSARSWTFFCD